MNIEYVTFDLPDDDGMSGQRWSFYLLRDHLVVDEFFSLARASKRHKMKVQSCWFRHDERNSTLMQAEVPYDSRIGSIAKTMWLSNLATTIRVGFESEL